MENNKSEENQSMSKLERLKWSTFFQSGFWVSIAVWISTYGWKLYNLELQHKGTRNYTALGLIAIIYLGAWLLVRWHYKEYKKESGRTW